MKKIILLICLLCGIDVQAQILGGYVTNSVLTNSYVPYSGATKSVNLNTQTFSVTGASTFSNVTVKGTESVTGTSTLNGLTNNGNEITVGTGSIGSTFTVNGAMKANSTLSVASTTSLNGITNTGNMTTTGTYSSGAGTSTFTGIQNNGALTATGVVTGGSFVTAGTYSSGSGTSTFSNILATGTFSGASTGTLTGDLYMNGGTRAIRGNAALELYSGGASNLNIRTSSGSAAITQQFAGTPYVTTTTLGTAFTGSLSCTANTIVVGSASLQGGNTGTVAVLSDAVFAVNLISTGGNPGDGLTYYAGNVGMSLVQTQGAMKVYVPYNSQIVGYTYNIYTNGTLGTTESATVSLLVNGTTSVLVTSSGNFSAAAQTYTASGLSQSISAGDYIESKMVCPTWATNPTDVRMGCTIYFVRRP